MGAKCENLKGGVEIARGNCDAAQANGKGVFSREAQELESQQKGSKAMLQLTVHCWVPLESGEHVVRPDRNDKPSTLSGRQARRGFARSHS